MRILKHLLLWSIWIIISSLSIIPIISTVPENTWWQIAYNFISLILVFYGSSYVCRRYFSRVRYDMARTGGMIDRALYVICKWEVVAMVAITAGYLALSMYLDTAVWKYKYINFFTHLDKRWTRVSFYLVTGAGYGIHKAIQAKYEARLKHTYLRLVTMEEYKESIRKAQESMPKKTGSRGVTVNGLISD